jgi:amino acid transporter
MSAIIYINSTIKRAWLWLLFNAFGIAVYLVLESSTFYPVEEAENPNRGDPVRDWLGAQFPFLALYLGANLTWLVMSWKKPSFKSQRLPLWLLVLLIWGIVLASCPLNLRAFVEIRDGTAWPGMK